MVYFNTFMIVSRLLLNGDVEPCDEAGSRSAAFRGRFITAVKNNDVGVDSASKYASLLVLVPFFSHNYSCSLTATEFRLC